MDDILILTPTELIRMKVLSMVSRPKTAKGLTDEADLKRLLLAFPELKSEQGAVTDRLRETGATEPVLAAWQELVRQEILPDQDDDF